MFFHSSSYTANPIACAAANANLAIWRDEPVLDRVADLGWRQQERLDVIARHPAVCGARRLGTIAAFEIEGGAASYLSAVAPRLTGFCRERGVLLRPLGNTVYVMPPYCIGNADLDEIYGVVNAFLSDAA
jgi:adenosylmethionine-8-amino-7-oxononanoate aminotransferase